MTIEWLQRVWNDGGVAVNTLHARTGLGNVFCNTQPSMFQQWQSIVTTQDKNWTPTGDLADFPLCATCKKWISDHL